MARHADDTARPDPAHVADDLVAPPVDRPAAWAWFFYAAGGFIVGQLAGILLVALAAALAGKSAQLGLIERSAEPPEWYVGVSLLGVWIGFAAGPLVASRLRGTGRLLADLGVRFKLVDLAGVVIGAGSQLVISLITDALRSHLRNFGAPTTKLVGASHGWGFDLIAVMTVLGAPFFEELFFRGLLLRALARLGAVGDPATWGGAWIRVASVVVLDGLLFGLAHGELEQLPFLAAFGVILALVALWTRRLGMNMVAHASFNFVAVMAVLASRTGAIR